MRLSAAVSILALRIQEKRAYLFRSRRGGGGVMSRRAHMFESAGVAKATATRGKEFTYVTSSG